MQKSLKSLYNINQEDILKFRELTAAASHDLGKSEDEITASEVIKIGEEKSRAPVFLGDIVFYRLALKSLFIVLIIAIAALTLSVYLGKGGTEGLVAVASGGIGAMAGLFAIQRQ
jgi:hypothetical protein